MAEGDLYLGGFVKPGRYGCPASAGLEIGERPLGGLMQLASWDDVAVAAALSMAWLPGFGETTRIGDVECYRLAPGRWWLRADDHASLDAALTAVPDAIAQKLDVSSSRVIVDLHGALAEDLMARLVTIDCSVAAMPVGRFAQTALHEVSVFVVRCGAQEFEIWLPVSWARSLWDYICDVAAPLGYEIAGDMAES